MKRVIVIKETTWAAVRTNKSVLLYTIIRIYIEQKMCGVV